MPIIFDLGEVQKQQVTVAPSPLAELMALLHVIAEPDHHRDRAREIQTIMQIMPAELRSELTRFHPLWARFRFRGMLPLTLKWDNSIEGELHALRSLDIKVFLSMAAEAVAGGRLNAEIDFHSDQKAFLDHCRRKSQARHDLAKALLADPELVRNQLLLTLEHAVKVFFGAIWQHNSQALSDRAEQSLELLERLSVVEFFASLTSSSHVFNNDQHVIFDKLQSAIIAGAEREFVVLPSFWTRPHVLIKYDKEYENQQVPTVLQYAPRTNDLSLEAAQQRMLVLANSARLQIIRHLVNEYCTTTELAARTNMPAPQVSRHLRQLRECGLLTSKRIGKNVQHRIRTEAVYRLGHEFLSVLTQ